MMSHMRFAVTKRTQGVRLSPLHYRVGHWWKRPRLCVCGLEWALCPDRHLPVLTTRAPERRSRGA